MNIRRLFSRNMHKDFMNKVAYLRFNKNNHIPPVRHFQTSPRTNLPISPLIWAVLKPIMKAGAIISGRSFRKWWRTLDPEQRQQFLKFSASRNKILGAAATLAGVAGVAGLYYQSHLQKTPVTGRTRFIALNDQQMTSIAKAEFEMINKMYAGKELSATHPYMQQVKRVVDTLISSNETFHDLPSVSKWTIYVIQSKDKNAFVIPTGDIFVFTGLLSVTENDDQLSIVLGHELSHVLLSHAAEKISYAQMLDWFIIVAMAAIWAVMPSDGIALVTQWFYNKVIQLLLHMPYSRKLEKEADQVGLELCAKACYDVREGSTFWMKMSCLSRVTPEDNIPEMLSTHPLSDKRAAHLNHITPQAVELRAACSCPELPPFDPRNKIEAYKTLTRNVIASTKTAQNLAQVPISGVANESSHS